MRVLYVVYRELYRFKASQRFWATVCKTVRAMLLVRCPVLSVCDVGALWPNGWTDQDETWHADRPQPWPHCVRWGSISPTERGTATPTFEIYGRRLCLRPYNPRSMSTYCSQTAVWVKMKLGMEAGLNIR